jgi:hypothetical protein
LRGSLKNVFLLLLLTVRALLLVSVFVASATAAAAVPAVAVPVAAAAGAPGGGCAAVGFPPCSVTSITPTPSRFAVRVVELAVLTGALLQCNT